MEKKVGVWIVGAQGGVATTLAVGLALLRKGAISPWGLVSELEPFKGLSLLSWNQFVIGGHEIRKTDCLTEALALCDSNYTLRTSQVMDIKHDLQQIDQNVRPGVILNVGSTITRLASHDFTVDAQNCRQAIDHIQADLQAFVDQHQLSHLITVNLASTEPPMDLTHIPADWEELEPLLNEPSFCLPCSSLYAIATLEKGWSYVNFTPSVGSGLEAIGQLALKSNACHCGQDGKTGETFLKSVLAPAFAHRNLEIMSWVGHNIFGNMDSVVLNDPQNKQTKVTSKDQLLSQILGYQPQTHVSIESIKSLGDWKTAWDHIHFRGFLGTPMIMTFTWQGCDSILAAPLVLDLVRFTECSARRGESGVLTHLASFFKSPLGTEQNDFSKQFQMLVEWSTQN